MEKIIKTLPELKSIIDANKFHTFDYTEGLSVSDGIEIFEIDIEETDDYQGASATLCIYPKEETEEKPFISFTLENIKYNLYID